MVQIPIEEFKRTLNRMVEKMPFEVTKRGKVLFVCYGPEGKPVDIPGKRECNDKPDVKIVAPVSSGETVYEPDPVKLPKAPKISASKAVSPIVSQLLAGVKKVSTIQHYPTCACAMCKPTPIK